jgi:hypothetical protein
MSANDTLIGDFLGTWYDMDHTDGSMTEPTFKAREVLQWIRDERFQDCLPASSSIDKAVNNNRAQYLAAWLQFLKDANYGGYVLRMSRDLHTKNMVLLGGECRRWC